ncbi:flavodoxin family protein [Kroppenstedtia sanguinis]|uniref:Flavodoxin family protein n=1 Tax=Kroppenstedtia sanguinis TaxID=1380684 RepID=A0ABW4CBK3_9BACL
MNILTILGSSRKDGNTEQLANQVTAGLPTTFLRLKESQILPIDDLRHEPGGFQKVDDDYAPYVEQLAHHEVIVFATPLYWYGMSGRMKNFVDRWSQSLRDPDRSLRDAVQGKPAVVVVTGGDAPGVKGLPLIQQFHWIFEFVGMNFLDYVIGTGNKPGEILQDKAALAKAQSINHLLHTLK